MEPPDYTGNEPPPDKHMGGYGQGIILQNDKYMLSVMNMVIMCHVHHPCKEMYGKNL